MIPEPSYGRHYLTSLFEPRSLAVVGATDKTGKIGEVLVSNLLAAGYRGRLLGVNPRYQSVHGVPCVARMADVVDAAGEPVDLAVIATPSRTIPGLIADCGQAGVRFAVVITAGFGESGDAGAALEEQVLAAARRHRVRIIGPNCLGILRPALGLNATFARGGARAGGTALVSQSGALCTAVLDWAAREGIGFSSMISLGGSVDVGFGEIFDYLTADEATHHILAYIEGVRDPRRFLGNLRAAARRKPVVLMKVGRHPAGSRAAVSHTGAIVGADDVFDAAVRRCGAVRVGSIGELMSAAQVLRPRRRALGPRLAVITNGGGPGVMAADRAADLGLPMAELSPATISALQPELPPNWSHGNPLDLIGDAGSARYAAAVKACHADRQVDGLLVMLTPQAMTDPLEVARALAADASAHAKPVIACWMGGDSVEPARDVLRAAGIPEFDTPEAAVDAYSTLVRIRAGHDQLLRLPQPFEQAPPADVAAARAIVATALREGRALLKATEAAALLSAFHIPVVETRAARTAEEAVKAAFGVGFPVAMKIRAEGITHKSEVGGVRLGLADAQAVRAAFDGMREAVLRARPDAGIEGVDIEPMVAGADARELLVGLLCDRVFGPAITFGSGGIAVEVMGDRAVALPPLDSCLAADMIDATRVARLLGAFRGRPAADRRAVEAVLMRISDMACELPELAELDINPLYADAGRVLALDARVVLKAPAARAPDARPGEHLALPPYPAALVSMERLPDGGAVQVRPIRPEDAAMEQKFVSSLSERARHYRFMSSMRNLSPDLLERFTHIDYDREMAFIAVDQADGVEVGVGRYCPCPDGETCEFAIVLADRWEGRGLGHLLMDKLAGAARAQGLRRMCGYILADNRPMLDLCRRLGYTISPILPEDGVREAVLDLQKPNVGGLAQA